MNQTKMKDRQFLGMTRETFFKKYGIIFILLLMVGIMLVVSPTFRTYNNVLSIMQSVAVNGCLALGMVFVITAGGIDLSIGSQLALTSVVIGIIIIGVIYNGMSLLQINSYYQMALKGILIILSVVLDNYLNKRRS